MDPLIVAVIGLVLMAALMLFGMPIAFTMLAAGVLGNAFLLSTPAATHMLATNVWEQFSSYGLSVIPLFVLMGLAEKLAAQNLKGMIKSSFGDREAAFVEDKAEKEFKKLEESVDRQFGG